MPMKGKLAFEVLAQSGALRSAFVPDGQRIYAIGDIHGRADLLERLLFTIEDDAKKCHSTCKNTIIYLGDYIDRGPKSIEVINVVISGQPEGFSAICLMGNHEQMMLQFLKGNDPLGNWLRVGGAQTALSYGVKGRTGSGWKEKANQIKEDLKNALPDAHFAFLENLGKSCRFGDFLFAHAGISLNRPLSDQSSSDLMWGNEEFLNCEEHTDCIVVHGHSAQKEVQIRLSRIGLDSGAYSTGVLSCAVYEKSDVRILDTKT